MSSPVPLVLALAIVLPAASPVSSANSPAPLPTLAILRLFDCANDHSTYPMLPSVLVTAAEMPSDPCSACPPGAFQVLSLPKVQSAPAVFDRNLVKLSVVPELSWRWIARILVAGRVAPELSAAIAGSFQVVTLPEKIFAMVAGLSWRLDTPVTLKTIAIGPTTIGTWMAGPLLHRASALGWSAAASGESEPAKSAVPEMKAC